VVRSWRFMIYLPVGEWSRVLDFRCTPFLSQEAYQRIHNQALA